jgi:Lipid A 3-O-deacylase (PagL)
MVASYDPERVQRSKLSYIPIRGELGQAAVTILSFYRRRIGDSLNLRPDLRIAAMAVALWMNAASAADIEAPIPKSDQPTSPVTYFDPYRYEFRFGAFDHGVGSVEKNTVDLNVEFVLPRLPFAQSEWWNFAIPRPHFGGLGNVSGRTSSVYAGLLWSVPVTQQFFAEAFVDGAIHNGSLKSGVPDMSNLGCRELFHSGGSLGYAISPQWSVIMSFDHLSNGRSLFGTRCPGNEGVNDYGLRFGYSF